MRTVATHSFSVRRVRALSMPSFWIGIILAVHTEGGRPFDLAPLERLLAAAG